jgi:hypothetical protein
LWPVRRRNQRIVPPSRSWEPCMKPSDCPARPCRSSSLCFTSSQHNANHSKIVLFFMVFFGSVICGLYRIIFEFYLQKKTSW